MPLIDDTPFRHGSWPPVARSLNDEAVKMYVPPRVSNFLAWCTGKSREVNFGSYVDVDENVRGKLFSIGQDRVYLSSNRRKDVPKHYALGMAFRHFLGSSEIAGLLNELGHSISRSKTLQYDSTLAERQLKAGDGLLPELVKKTPTTLAFENNDFSEETRTGAETTQNTNGIAIQREPRLLSPRSGSLDENMSIERSHKLTVSTPKKQILQYLGKKK